MMARVADTLGWVSLGLGVAGLAAPRAAARLMGVSDDDGNRDLVRAVALREIACGIGLLAAERPSGWLWARVGGDVMDLALLGAAWRSETTDRRRLAGAVAAGTAFAIVDTLCARQAGAQAGADIELHQTVTINREPGAVYGFWRELANLPRFLSHLDSVVERDRRVSHWAAKGPAGSRFEWDAEITEDQPDRLLAWRSLAGADIDNEGSVRFEPAPAGRGTVVRVFLRYRPPGGRAGAALARLFGREPGQEIRHDLRQLKQVLETGEVIRSEASVHAGPHPAQPPPQQPRM